MIEGELRRTFPNKALSLNPTGSQGNHITYVAKIGDLTGFVRIEDGPEHGDYLELETRIITQLHKLGIPTPEVYTVDATRSRVPFAWQVLQYVPDPDLKRLHKDGRLHLDGIAREIGRYIAEWQTITPNGYGPFKPSSGENGCPFTGYHDSYAAYFYLHLERHVTYLTERGLLTCPRGKEILKAIDDNRGLLELSESCLVHKDLALWNILGTSERISAFIDWEDAIGGDPMDDFSLLGCFHTGLFISEALEGYRTSRPLSDNHQRRFWLHLLRNMLVKAVIRVGGGYFQETDNLFLMDAGATGSDLKLFTQQRIDAALRGLMDNKEISQL